MKTASQFRKALTMSAAAVLAACSIPMMSASAAGVESVRLMGDINKDNRVDVSDAIDSLQLYNLNLVDLAENTVNDDNYGGDIDMNGQVDLNDTIGILTYYTLTNANLNPLWADLRRSSYVDGQSYYGNTDPEKQHYFEKTGMYLEIGCASAKPGETVTVPVYIAGITDLAGLQFFMSTPDSLTLDDVNTDLPISESTGKTWNPDNGAFVWAQERGNNLSVTDGTVICTYTYTVPETAQKGDFFLLTQDAEHTMFVAVDGSNIDAFQYTAVSGCITVE